MWGFVLLGSTHCDRVFPFFRGSLVTRWEAPGGIKSSSGVWPTKFPSVLWCCWLGLLTCKTVSQITYTVLVETLNPAQSINHSSFFAVLTVKGCSDLNFVLSCADGVTSPVFATWGLYHYGHKPWPWWPQQWKHEKLMRNLQLSSFNIVG